MRIDALMVIIFLNDKLVSVDTILPFLMELKNRNPSLRFRFFCAGSPKTLDTINSNVVLKTVINDLGKLSYIGELKMPLFRKFLGNLSVESKLAKVINLAFTLIYVMFHDAKVIHFKFFDNPKLSWLTNIAPKRFIYFQQNCWGSSPLVDAADNVARKRIFETSAKSRGVYVTFDGYWSKFVDAKKYGLPRFHIRSTRLLPIWIATLERHSDYFDQNEMSRAGIENDGRSFAILVSNLTQSTISESLDCPLLYFKKTLKILWSEFPDRAVFVKRHPITDVGAMMEAIRESKHEKVYLTEMHSGVLGRVCCVTICNSFSYAIPDAWHAGCRTMEFGKYSDGVRKLAGNNSIRPEFVDSYVYYDDKLFTSELKRLVNEGRVNRTSLNEPDEGLTDLLQYFAIKKYGQRIV
ncbi:MAG: hypothetical protein CBC25_01230 [Pelagibacteraceae bacterium TMED65]|nr:MAG: hypothetical protein CBC25_01230 [Pelagibacteraceae bacterium TMED65]|tara:strand:- start:278 stop:1501 length:1224 start_codon:yes stop_codon:yes gene_type:complete